MAAEEPLILRVIRTQVDGSVHQGTDDPQQMERVEGVLSDGTTVHLFTRTNRMPNIADIEMDHQTVAHVRALAREAWLLLD